MFNFSGSSRSSSSGGRRGRRGRRRRHHHMGTSTSSHTSTTSTTSTSQLPSFLPRDSFGSAGLFSMFGNGESHSRSSNSSVGPDDRADSSPRHRSHSRRRRSRGSTSQAAGRRDQSRSSTRRRHARTRQPDVPRAHSEAHARAHARAHSRAQREAQAQAEGLAGEFLGGDFSRFFGMSEDDFLGRRRTHRRRRQRQRSSDRERAAAEEVPGSAPPTSEEGLEQLPTFTFTAARAKRLKNCSEGCVCAVCLEDFQSKELLCLLPCQHIFHDTCIKPWISKHNTCPVCRFELPLADASAERERRKRMIALFSLNGLKIMELGNHVELIYCSLEDKLRTVSLKEKLPLLRHCRAELFNIVQQLDLFESFKSERTRDDRRLLIRKIQAMQDEIDERMQRITVL